MEIALIRRGTDSVGESEANDAESEGSLLKNEPSKDWVVHKYGGTAVGKFPWEIARNVKEDLSKNRVSVVCSARSTHVKTQGTTTRLVSTIFFFFSLLTQRLLMILD